jgi:hypothetical protein
MVEARKFGTMLPSCGPVRPACRLAAWLTKSRVVETGLMVRAAHHEAPGTIAYRAISLAITRLKGTSAAGIEPQAFPPAVQSCSATAVLFSIASL